MSQRKAVPDIEAAFCPAGVKQLRFLGQHVVVFLTSRHGCDVIVSLPEAAMS